MQASVAQVLILTVILCASLAAFWFRFRRVIHVIRAAKPEKHWNLWPIAPRAGRFIWEVLLQGKVIFDRPLPGIAHAFVFWGFCAFALITIAHFAAGVGLNLLPTQYAVVRGYRYFVALFAIAVAVSVLGTALRLLVPRPVCLGPQD